MAATSKHTSAPKTPLVMTFPSSPSVHSCAPWVVLQEASSTTLLPYWFFSVDTATQRVGREVRDRDPNPPPPPRV